MGKLTMMSVIVGGLGLYLGMNKIYSGTDRQAIMDMFARLSDRLGVWAMPTYVILHTINLSLCLPSAVFFEGGASIIFGFFRGVLCIFSAKVLGASLSFWIGRFLFRSSSSATSWIQRNKYFNVISKGVARDGWKFVLLARFSPAPSYVINYGLAATDVGFFADFLLPTVIGCIPMILQNASVGSLASAAVTSDKKQGKSQITSYLFPILGILSSIVISMRVKKYSSEINTFSELSDDNYKATDTKNADNSKPELPRVNDGNNRQRKAKNTN